ncbi:hypothetical protein J1N35_044569 [Gossypium stocksii]|uniref:Uncharacterized protein n=1 Tax=Gossypium stocksii TaxID=47602 RepID=A0A9D3U9Q5_9ROSI|nr:hypothetical protein J1N35_044569 [Gossypium stocksii]
MTRTCTSTICEVWSKACHLFAAISSAKFSRLKHDLHSLKKGNLPFKEYVAKIKGTCNLLEASGHLVSTAEQVNIVLARLSVEFDSMLTITSFSSEPLTME